MLTRPLGATIGDTLTKPPAQGGLALGRFTSSIAVAMIVVIALTTRRERLPAPTTG